MGLRKGHYFSLQSGQYLLNHRLKYSHADMHVKPVCLFMEAHQKQSFFFLKQRASCSLHVVSHRVGLFALSPLCTVFEKTTLTEKDVVYTITCLFLSAQSKAFCTNTYCRKITIMPIINEFKQTEICSVLNKFDFTALCTLRLLDILNIPD